MTRIIKWLLSNWTSTLISLGAALLIGMWLWIGHLNHESIALRVANTELLQRETQMQANYKQYQERSEATISALETERAATAKRQATVIKLHKDVAHVKPENDGPVAPVLRGVLEQLRNPAAHNID